MKTLPHPQLALLMRPDVLQPITEVEDLEYVYTTDDNQPYTDDSEEPYTV